jgi:uncharacterized protein (TIGR02145 family)
MQYVTTEGARGICPAGWHIPTDGEWHTLENYLKNNGQTCDAGRSPAFDCSSAGEKLKPGGTSHFEGNAAGNSFGLAFNSRDTDSSFWSSSESGANAYYRAMISGFSTVYREASGKTHGYSVRCLKN